MTRVRTHHVGITVSDLDASVAFYRDVLGLAVVDRFEVSGEAFETAVGVEGATARFVHLAAVGENREPDGTSRGSDRSNREGVDPTAVTVDGHAAADGVRIELVEYEPGADPCTADRIDQRGAKHVGYAVDDLGTFYEGLPDDVETLSEPRTTASGTTILFLRDPEDNLVEVLEA